MHRLSNQNCKCNLQRHFARREGDWRGVGDLSCNLEAVAVVNGENGENEPERLKRNNYNCNHYNYNYNYILMEPGKASEEDKNLETIGDETFERIR